MRLTKYLAAAAAVVVAGVAAHSAGMFQTLPLIGQGSYCASTIGSGPVQAGPTGFGAGAASPGATGLPLCGQTVPAGPATFAGTEVIVTDLYTPGTVQIAGGPATGLTSILQLGQGPLIDVTAPATATIPNSTPFYILDGAQAGAFTITMPASPIEGQIQRIACDAATVGVLTVSANAGQSLKVNPAAACVAGVGYAWRYQASNTTWYRIQ